MTACRSLWILSSLCVLGAGCSETDSMVTPTPPWRDVACYDKEGAFRARSAEITTPFSYSASPLFLLDTEVEAEAQATSVPDLELIQLRNVVTHDGRTLPLVGIGYSDSWGKLRAFEDVPVKFALRRRRVPNPAPDQIDAVAWTLRTPGGQLLLGRLEGTIDEHVAELMPEISAQLAGQGESTDIGCNSLPDTQDMMQYLDVRFDTKNESVVLSSAQRANIAIGCVEYILAAGYFMQNLTDRCLRRGDMFRLHVTRRALIAPATP